MKFWNKRKEVRLRCWFCVELHLRDHHKFMSGNFEGFLTHREFNKLKVELQNAPSEGKFYMDLMKREVWFERHKDAVWFALTHSELLR